jgi:hypothetical protein
MHLLGENGEELVDEKVNLSLVRYSIPIQEAGSS